VAARCDQPLLGDEVNVSSYSAEAAKEKSIAPLPKPVREARPLRRYFLRGA